MNCVVSNLRMQKISGAHVRLGPQQFGFSSSLIDPFHWDAYVVDSVVSTKRLWDAYPVTREYIGGVYGAPTKIS